MPDAETTDAETTASAEAIIEETLRTLMEQKGVSGVDVRPESKLTTDLGLDSLDLAELSAVLEEEVGHDPFSAGIVPETVGELVAYFNR